MLTPLLLGTSLLSAHGEWIYDRNGLHDENGNKPVDKSQITSVKFSNNVTHIGDAAFYGCSALNNITIPASVTSIEGWAFWGCRSLESITISEKFYEGKDKAKENARMKIHATCKVHYSE